jgi:acyl carrier protein
MNREEIRKSLQDNLAEITDVDSLVLADDTAPDEVPGWDSVNHIKLLFAIEAELNIGFDVSEMAQPGTVAALVDVIQGKLQAA